MSMRSNFDISAYLVIGPENTLGRPVPGIIAEAVAAGFTCVQIRSKVASARELISLIGETAGFLAEGGWSEKVALLVDDRLDVVLAARAQGFKVDGLHIGQEDIPPAVCRKYLGESAILGMSARVEALFSYVEQEDTGIIDYFGLGPLHETPTKIDCGRAADGRIITRDLAEITHFRKISPLPVVVGGGVKQNDLPGLARTGVEGFFVVSAVAGAENPGKAARNLVQTWRKEKVSFATFCK